MTGESAPSRPGTPDGPSLSDVELQELRDLCVRAAVEAGGFIVAQRPEALGVSATKSTELDVVTAMDTASEALLRRLIAQARPDDAILGEESGVEPGASGLTWVIDPIDGTVNYLYGLPGFAVSVAVVVGDPTRAGQWSPVAGAVINPSTAEIFHAARGAGAHRQSLRRDGDDGTPGSLGPPSPLRVSHPSGLSHALVGTGFAYDRGMRVEQGQVAAQVLLQVRDLRRSGAAAVDLCSVAAGRLDAYYERGLAAWDLAAGMLIVTEAGGRCTGLAGRDAGTSMVVAAGEDLHPAFLDLIEELHGVDADRTG